MIKGSIGAEGAHTHRHVVAHKHEGAFEALGGAAEHLHQQLAQVLIGGPAILLPSQDLAP